MTALAKRNPDDVGSRPPTASIRNGPQRRRLAGPFGSGPISAAGSCKALDTQLTGSDGIDAPHMASDTLSVAVQGPDSTRPFPLDAISIAVAGSSDVTVYGNHASAA